MHYVAVVVLLAAYGGSVLHWSETNVMADDENLGPLDEESAVVVPAVQLSSERVVVPAVQLSSERAIRAELSELDSRTYQTFGGGERTACYVGRIAIGVADAWG